MSGDLPVAPSIFGSFEAPPSAGSEKSGPGNNKQGSRVGQSGKLRGNEKPRGGKSGGKPPNNADSGSTADSALIDSTSTTSNPPANTSGKGARRGPPPASNIEGRNKPPPKTNNRNNKKPADGGESVATLPVDNSASKDVAEASSKKGEKKERGKNPRKGGGKNSNIVSSEENKDTSATSFKEIVAPPLPPKKTFKLIVRKLPPSVDYTKDTFEQHLSLVLAAMQITSPELLAEVRVDHFIEGKLSRKRGPVNGAGVIVFTDETLYQRFLAECPSIIPFLPDEAFGQPEVTPAIFIKAFRQKEKADVKYMNTFMEDKEFLAFQEQMNKPKSVQKAEAIAANAATATAAAAATNAPVSSSSTAAATATTPLTNTQKIQQLLQNNALLQYLREKSNRAMSRRRKKAVAGLFAAPASAKLTRKEKEKLKLLKKKEKAQQGSSENAKGLEQGKKQSVAAKEIAKILNAAKEEGRTTFSRAEKDALAKWRKKEKKQAKKDEKIMAEAMELMRLNDGDGRKTLEDCVKEVKRNHKKNRGSEKMADGSTSVSTSLKREQNAVVAGESSTATSEKASSRRGGGRGGGRGRRNKDNNRDENKMTETAPSVMRVLKRDATAV